MLEFTVLMQKEKIRSVRIQIWLFSIGKTPEKLIVAGLSDNTIGIGYKVIEKAQNNKNADHNLSKETINKVWETLKNPIAVIKLNKTKMKRKKITDILLFLT